VDGLPADGLGSADSPSNKVVDYNVRTSLEYYQYYHSQKPLDPRLPPPLHNWSAHIDTHGNGMAGAPKGLNQISLEEADEEDELHKNYAGIASSVLQNDEPHDARASGGPWEKSLFDRIQDDFPRTDSPLYDVTGQAQQGTALGGTTAPGSPPKTLGAMLSSQAQAMHAFNTAGMQQQKPRGMMGPQQQMMMASQQQQQQQQQQQPDSRTLPEAQSSLPAVRPTEGSAAPPRPHPHRGVALRLAEEGEGREMLCPHASESTLLRGALGVPRVVPVAVAAVVADDDAAAAVIPPVVVSSDAVAAESAECERERVLMSQHPSAAASPLPPPEGSSGEQSPRYHRSASCEGARSNPRCPLQAASRHQRAAGGHVHAAQKGSCLLPTEPPLRPPPPPGPCRRPFRTAVRST